MTIPFNDLNRTPPALRADLAASVQRVLDRGWYILGPEVAAFESEFAAYCGTTHCVSVANGTDALEIALRALGIKPGDGVATVANAGGYSSTAIRSLGAEPVYVEIDAVSMNMQPAALSSAMNGRVRAVIATHLYGRMADLPALLEITSAAGVPLIEDCAQAHGATLDGRKAGSWGALGCFSFYPTKNLGACGDGGAITTNDGALANRVKLQRQYGWTGKYRSTEHGRNSRLDEMQAAILRTKLPLLDGWNRRRRQIAAIYNDALAGSEITCPRGAGEAFVAHLYVVRTAHRDALRDELKAAGIATEIHYPIPDHLQEAVRREGRTMVSLPGTERAANEILTLPCYPELRNDETERIANALREIAVRGQA
ncbi:MAG TPA: DegT/DnrJ/EryC1/StrS family aminotransferase [Candidatus Acidoferrum sp.]|nr:DegT/DnrJ/EryC1/StrS family aminotransferase [Candidatus Acidoferrum sp.]